jgi:hypothetical protein
MTLARTFLISYYALNFQYKNDILNTRLAAFIFEARALEITNEMWEKRSILTLRVGNSKLPYKVEMNAFKSEKQ